MAKERPERPYSAFNFLVKLGDAADPNVPQAGFQEVSGLGIEITMQEYRAGNFKINAPIKIPAMFKASDVTLKRGAIGVLDLYQWIDEVRNGDMNARRTVVIQLQNESRTDVVMEWILSNAVPMKYTAPSFNGKGTDVGIEEFVLSVEDIALQ